MRDYIDNGNILTQASWPLSAFGPAISDTWVTNNSGASAAITLTTNTALEDHTRSNTNEEPLLVLHTLSGGNNDWPGSTSTSQTTGISALTASSIVAVCRFRNWATGNYMSYSHGYVKGNPGSGIVGGY